MNKKGFTLTELMGAIIILGVLLLLTLPAIDKTLKNAKQTAYDSQIDSIIKASSDWALKNPESLPENDGESITIYLSELKLSAGVELNLKNPKTGKIMSNNTSIIITKNNNKYNYAVNVIDITSNEDSDVPILIIDGNIVDYVEVNQDGKMYTVPSASAKTANGLPIDDSYISYQIIKDNNVVSVVDTSKLGTYTVNYTVTYEGKTGNYQKTVIVRDTTKPEINIGKELFIHPDDIDVNLMYGVTVFDNSGETLTPTIKSTISNIEGIYYVYYSATDSSGNIMSKKREVTVSKNASLDIPGTVAYFNPLTGKKCTDYNASTNSNVGYKTGCMKWYTIGSTAEKVDLISDHNLTAETPWNSSGNNSTGPSEVLTTLKSETGLWSGVPTRYDKYKMSNNSTNYTIDYSGSKARLITIQEITDIVGNSKVDKFGNGQFYYFETLTTTRPTSYGPNGGKYKWLYERTRVCTTYGCDVASTDDVYGYWTASAYSSSTTSAWRVYFNGGVGYASTNQTGENGAGIRPVITIDKNLLK